MRGMIRTLALGAVLVTATATAGMAQGVNNTGYGRRLLRRNSSITVRPHYGDPAKAIGYRARPLAMRRHGRRAAMVGGA